MITDRDVKKLKESFKDTFATKDDLKRFATKDDLKRFATKDDLKRFATKDDLQSELEPVKKDLSDVKKSLKKGLQSVRRDIASLRIVTDEIAKKHHQRIERVERHLNLPHLVD